MRYLHIVEVFTSNINKTLAPYANVRARTEWKKSRGKMKREKEQKDKEEGKEKEWSLSGLISRLYYSSYFILTFRRSLTRALGLIHAKKHTRFSTTILSLSPSRVSKNRKLLTY